MPRHFRVLGRRRWRHSTLLQIAGLLLAWGVGELVVRGLGLPVPGGLVGMGLLLLALARGWLQLGSLRRGATRLIGEMLLFFVPAVLAVLDHPELLGWLGLKLLAVIVAGTVIVMGSTAMVVELALRWTATAPEAQP